MKSNINVLFALIAMVFLFACGGASDFEVREDSGAQPDAAEPDAAEPDAAEPPTGQAACEQWERGFEDPQAISDCYYELGPDGVECAQETRQFWFLSCNGDCESLNVDQVSCMCECMLNATPWDGEAGAPCAVDYGDLYECWVRQ